MKKTLVAIAALASVTAFAQTTVKIEGYFDRGYVKTDNTNTLKSSKLIGSNAGTTGIRFMGTQDLGGGLSAGFLIGTDFADLAGANQDATTTVASSIQTGGFNNAQSYLEFKSNAVGTLRLGSVNNEILTNATSVASPALSTGIGSTYSSAFSTHDGYGTGVTGSGGIVNLATQSATNGGARGIRQANTIKYISPTISGITAVYGMAPKNDSNGGTVDTVGVQDVSIRYTNGPVDVMYTSLEYDVGSTAPLNGSLTASTKSKHTLLGASYSVMPTLKLHAGSGGSTVTTTSLGNSSTTQYGVTWNATSAINVMYVAATVNDKNTTNYDRKMSGLGVDYNLSKTTRAYFRMDNINLNTVTASSGTSIKRNAFGISTSF
jgi:hypothetical protein